MGGYFMETGSGDTVLKTKPWEAALGDTIRLFFHSFHKHSCDPCYAPGTAVCVEKVSVNEASRKR